MRPGGTNAGRNDTTYWRSLIIKVASPGDPGAVNVFDTWGYRHFCYQVEEVPAPRLLASMESEEWVVLIFEEIARAPPILPWQPRELNRVLDAMATLASILTPSPIPAPPATVPGGVNAWASLCLDPSALDELPGLDVWARTNLERLSEVASTSDSAHKGPTLRHTDIRADNILLTAERVVFVDWPAPRLVPRG